MISENQCKSRKTQTEETDQNSSLIQNKSVPLPLNGGFMPSTVDNQCYNLNMLESAFCHFQPGKSQM